MLNIGTLTIFNKKQDQKRPPTYRTNARHLPLPLPLQDPITSSPHPPTPPTPTPPPCHLPGPALLHSDNYSLLMCFSGVKTRLDENRKQRRFVPCPARQWVARGALAGSIRRQTADERADANDLLAVHKRHPFLSDLNKQTGSIIIYCSVQ